MGSIRSDSPDQDYLPLIRLYTRAFVHALNNHLSGASGYQQLLAIKLEQGTPPDAEKLLEYAKEIENSLAEVERILRGLSTWAKPAAPRLQPISLSGWLGSMLDRWCDGHPGAASRIEREIPDSLPSVRADEEMLRDLLEAVIDNAVQATNQDESAIGVSLARKQVDGEGPSRFAQSIRVKDQGCGIEPTRIPYLQLPILAAFRNPGVEAGEWHGRGFGLPTAYSLARQMGGRLMVESRPGEGTAVTLTLSEADETKKKPTG